MTTSAVSVGHAAGANTGDAETGGSEVGILHFVRHVEFGDVKVELIAFWSIIEVELPFYVLMIDVDY